MDELLERIRAGDQEAYALLVRDAWGPLFRYLTGLLGSAEGAQDAAQEALVRVWERRERWDAGSARALVFRIARNAGLDARRRAVVRERTPTGLLPTPEAPERPDDALEASELERLLRGAIEDLPPRRREAFELIRFHGLSHAEAAAVMGISPQTVANQLGHALRELRGALEGVVDDAPREGEERRSGDG